MEIKTILVDANGKVRDDFSKEEQITLLFETIIFSGPCNFYPDFQQMGIEPFERLASLHERDVYDLYFDDESLQNEESIIFDISDFQTISDGNLVAFDEEFRMFDSGEIKEFSDPYMTIIHETEQEILNAHNKAVESADKAIQETFEMVCRESFLEKCMPTFDLESSPQKKLPELRAYRAFYQKKK
ncbi:MAG: hypothetical protein JXA43_03540 [Candidatus Diapherotrites archaeon]|nr:hypothetical protein [Candidatus Diapherotrites archaeon]